MNNSDIEINNLIMREIGLEVGPRNRIYDQDTGMEIRINGMDVVAPGCYGGRQSIEFDPYNNKKMMNQFFSYFLDKRSEETDIDVLAYYNVGNGEKSQVECRMSNNEKISSGKYIRDSLKYTDLMIQLNGDVPQDLSKYDSPIEYNTVKKRSSTNAKNKPNTKTAKNC